MHSSDNNNSKQNNPQNPSVCLLFSVRRVLLLVIQLYTGLLPFMPLKETHLEIFMPAHLIKLVNFIISVKIMFKFLNLNMNQNDY